MLHPNLVHIHDMRWSMPAITLCISLRRAPKNNLCPVYSASGLWSALMVPKSHDVQLPIFSCTPTQTQKKSQKQALLGSKQYVTYLKSPAELQVASASHGFGKPQKFKIPTRINIVHRSSRLRHNFASQVLGHRSCPTSACGSAETQPPYHCQMSNFG